MHGMRLLLRIDGDSTCSVPPQWTDAVEPDPEIILGKRRAVARVADLIELADLIARLLSERSRVGNRKDNYAANVRTKMSQTPFSSARNGSYCAHILGRRSDKSLDSKIESGVCENTKEQTKERCRPSQGAAIRKRKRSSGRAR